MKLPTGTIQEGSLANPKLIQDAMSGVSGKSATLGCNKIDSLKPDVVSMPTGEVGSCVRHEKWIGTCEGKNYPIEIASTNLAAVPRTFRPSRNDYQPSVPSSPKWGVLFCLV